MWGDGLRSEAGVRCGWESGATLCLGEECDLSSKGEGEHWKVTLWDLSCRQTTLAPGSTRSASGKLVKKEFSYHREDEEDFIWLMVQWAQMC